MHEERQYSIYVYSRACIIVFKDKITTIQFRVASKAYAQIGRAWVQISRKKTITNNNYNI